MIRLPFALSSCLGLLTLAPACNYRFSAIHSQETIWTTDPGSASAHIGNLTPLSDDVTFSHSGEGPDSSCEVHFRWDVHDRYEGTGSACQAFQDLLQKGEEQLLGIQPEILRAEQYFKTEASKIKPSVPQDPGQPLCSVRKVVNGVVEMDFTFSDQQSCNQLAAAREPLEDAKRHYDETRKALLEDLKTAAAKQLQNRNPFKADPFFK